MAELSEYLEISVVDARHHFRAMGRRSSPPPGTRQVDFTPTETLLCLAASFVVDHGRFGSSSAPRAPEPVQLLARLFRRPPSSVIAKMNNLDGTRSHGARWDRIAGAALRHDTARFSDVYRTLLTAARAEGLGNEALPDFLHLEDGGELELLGQDELDRSVIERELVERLRGVEWRSGLTEDETVQILLASARVGQHRFAMEVLHNCGQRCVFCGFAPSAMGAKRMLIASHIKPWRVSAPRERLDPTNGLAACPTHDVAFDTGLLTVNGGLRIHISPAVSRAAEEEPLVDHYFARPPLRERLLLPDGARQPEPRYLSWHRDQIFLADGVPIRTSSR